MLTRCLWASSDDPLYQAYHDKEWGVPIHDDRLLFEFLILEGAQAGLSWYSQCPGVPKDSAGVRQLRCLYVAVRRR
jgi:hypothetical protein